MVHSTNKPRSALIEYAVMFEKTFGATSYAATSYNSNYAAFTGLFASGGSAKDADLGWVPQFAD
jgi:hypothetical protein